jgi:hypothetical protein
MMRDIASEMAGDIGQIPVVGTSTTDGAGGGTTVVDATIAIPNADVDFLDGVWLMIDEKVGAGPEVGEVQAITDYAAATGTLTTAAFTGQIKAGTDYSLWRHVHPNVALRFLQGALRAQRHEVVAPLSLMPNGDFETALSSADWVDTGSGNPVLATAQRFVRAGATSLELKPSASDHGVQGINLQVIGGRHYVLTAEVMVDTIPPITVKVFDVTAADTIKKVRWSGEEYAEIEIEFIVPETTEQIRIDINGPNGSTVYVDNVNLHRLESRRIHLPSWVQRPSDVHTIGYYERGKPAATATEPDTVFELDESRFISVWDFENNVDQLRPEEPFWVDLSREVHRPLWIKAVRPYAELALATDTTTANHEVTVNTALWFLFNHFATTAAAAGDKDAYGIWKDRRRDMGGRNQVASDERATATMKGMSMGLYR